MATATIYEGQTFYVPRFEITIQGQALKKSVIQDVKEVTYTDSLETLDSFEFVLHDWDPLQNAPKYSSPYDEQGKLRKLPNNEGNVPNFDPGTDITLKMGYYGPENPTTMLSGKIVSIAPNFPADGMPSLRIRALNPLHSLRKSQETMNFENKTDSEIAQEIGESLDIDVEIPNGQIQQETRYEFMSFANEYPINFLMGRARRIGYDLYINQPDEGGDPVLFFGKSKTTDMTYELEWGRSLVSFQPIVKTKDQVTRVVVRGWRPGGRGDDRRIVGTATWADVDLDLPDPKMLQAIDSALQEFEEQVVEDPIENQTEADQKALGILTKKLQDLVTGKGTTVGLPKIRAGKPVIIKGIGNRYSGKYLITESTHKIDGTGYRTEFSARLEGSL